MEQAPDLTALMHRFYAAVSQGDVAFMEQFISQHEEVLMIGTDPNEWWADAPTIIRTLQAQAQAGIQAVPGELQAYRHGAVGWVADRGTFVLPDGSAAPFRWTAVFLQEDGDWKLVQGHASVGVPNEEVIGTDLNV